MLDLFRAHRLVGDPLGPVETWPANLRILVDVCLSSRFPMLVCWGPDLLMLYNDGYRTLLGESKHPDAWGRPVREVWPEVWDVIGPMFEGVTSGGPATWVEDELLVVDRAGYLEEAYFTWSYGAIHDDAGAVVGVAQRRDRDHRQGARRASRRRRRPGSSPRWPTPRTPRTYAVAPSRCSARTATTTSRATCAGLRRATRLPTASTTRAGRSTSCPSSSPGCSSPPRTCC